MSEPVSTAMTWPSNGITEVPFRVYTDQASITASRSGCSRARPGTTCAWRSRFAKPGDYVATTVGETAVIVVRDAAGAINAFVNRCAHRGNLLCLERQGNVKEFSCIYHGWIYDLAGQLTGVAFEHGVQRQGGMPPEFRKEEHQLQRLRVAELGGLVFGTFSDADARPGNLARPRRHPRPAARDEPHAACPRPQHPGAAEQLEALFREREGYLPRQRSCICS